MSNTFRTFGKGTCWSRTKPILTALRSAHVQRLVAAVPVAPRHIPVELRREVDDLVVLATPSIFHAIGQFYLDFQQVQDEDVVNDLEKARTALYGKG
jgi:putative phosphoribosyl transferase